MAYTSTETKLQVLAGDNAHIGVLEVGFQRMAMSGARLAPDEPPYDYGGDAEAILNFLVRFLPGKTLTEFARLVEAQRK